MAVAMASTRMWSRYAAQTAPTLGIERVSRAGTFGQFLSVNEVPGVGILDDRVINPLLSQAEPVVVQQQA